MVLQSEASSFVSLRVQDGLFQSLNRDHKRRIDNKPVTVINVVCSYLSSEPCDR